MEKVLGIDLGTNSIGWAIREVNPQLENQIIDKGVLTFDKGVAEDKSGEHPMVQKRTECRGKRRNYQAEKYRKYELLECLIENKMCPLTIDELNEWRHYKKGVGRKYPTSNSFISWLRFDFDGDGKPDFERLGYSKHESYYLFRSLIIDETKVNLFKLEPHIIGRVLYQIVQRRGYNDGSEIDESEKNELSKTIMKGGGEAGATGANEIEPFIEKYKTLGAALYQMQLKGQIRIRKRYNLRSKFEAEIKEICRVQQIENLYKKIWSAVIWQRPLRGQKGLVGICTFEHNKSRCPISHPLYEEYRTWVFINNLKIRPINIDKDYLPIKEILNNYVYPEFYKASTDFKLSSIKKKLEKLNYEITAKFSEETKVISVSFLNQMKEIYGSDWKEEVGWNALLNSSKKEIKYNIEDLWHIHFTKVTNKSTGQTPFDFLKQFGIQKLSLNEQQSEKFAKIRIQQGYATLSITAIKKILPYLQNGFIYSEAVYLANLPKVLNTVPSEEIKLHFSEQIRILIKQNNQERKYILAVNELINSQLNSDTRFGMDEAYQLDQDDLNDIQLKLREVFGEFTWNNMTEIDQNNAIVFVKDKYLNFLQKRIYSKNIFEKVERLHDKIFNWLAETYTIPNNRKKYLWHPSEQETYAKPPEKNGIKFLGSPEPISKGFKNPMALKTLHRLKKLINYLIEVKKIDEDTRIVIEIARELNDANQRKAIERWQRDREAENKKYKIQIEAINLECGTMFNSEDKNIIDKIRLWEEQKHLCIYTGKTIGLCDVLNGSKFDFEHSIPASMSFDNELKNLTIADKFYNQQIKGKKLPSECPNFEHEYTLNGCTYKPIMETLQCIFGRYIKVEQKRKYGKVAILYKFEKIIDLENTYQEWKDKDSDDKEIKDNIVIKRHYLKMELDYWRYKLNTFITAEYKSGWRNSQLRDTQTITKYSLPYLKTIFKKIDVQKGSITADFRKIYKVQPRLSKKERTKHSHHAIDAAVLTLIPPASIRDKILLKYNEAIDIDISYHERPRDWNNFESFHILNIEDEILINYLPEHRTLTPTKKIVRKRGKVQYVKEKLEADKWQYKINQDGNKIPIVANGDTIRGSLHQASYFGAIKSGDEIILVKRRLISEFKKIEECKQIVDKKVSELVQIELERRMVAGQSFDQAKIDPIHFHKGNEVIKKVRCKVAAGRGFLSTNKAIKIHKHDFVSKHSYKQHVYAQNDTNAFCLYYEKEIDEKKYKAFRIIALFELSQLKFSSEMDLYQEKYYNSNTIKKGKIEIILPLVHVLKVGQNCIFFDEDIEEIRTLSIKEIQNRVYKIYKFNDIGVTKYIYLQNHLEAKKNEELGNGDGEFDSKKYQSRLMLNSDKFNCAIEGKHFEINIDGQIRWL